MRGSRFRVPGGVLALVGALVASVLGSETAFADAPAACGAPPPALQNGSFEQPAIGLASGSWGFLPVSTADLVWNTTDPTQVVEIWIANSMGIGAAPQGSRVAELNANNPSMLYQDLATVPGQKMVWTLRHRGRSGVETMNVTIGPAGGALQPQVPRGQGTPAITNDTLSWGAATGTYVVPAGQTLTRFGFQAVVPASGSYGNLLDDIVFGVAATACDDTDSVVAGQSATVPVLSNDQGTGLTLSTPTPPANGTVALVGGLPRYTPAPGFAGTDTFSYSVTDVAGESSSAQVSVRVTAPDPPTAVAKQSRGLATTVQSVILPKPVGGTVRLLDRSGIPRTSVAVAGEGTYELDPETGRVQFTPAPGFTGRATPVGYRVTDAYGQSAHESYQPQVDAPLICASQRRIKLHWRVPDGTELRSILVRIDGRRTAKLDGAARAVVVDLSGRPQAQVGVSITGRSRRGHLLGTVRRYRTCTARMSHRPLPTLRLLAARRS